MIECESHFYFIENLFILSVHIYIPDGVNDIYCVQWWVVLGIIIRIAKACCAFELAAVAL